MYTYEQDAPRLRGKWITLFLIFALLFTAICSVVFTTDAQAAKGKIDLSKTSVSVTTGTTYTLKLTDTKNKTIAKGVTWKSSSKKIATVSSKGVVKGIKAGKATISAKYKGKTYKCTITVKNPALKSKKQTIQVGKTYQQALNGADKKAITKDVKWTSSNKKVATVSAKGLIKGVKTGKATISAKYKGKTYKCEITVEKSKTPELSAKKKTMSIGEKYKLKLLAGPKGTAIAGEEIAWSSSDTNIATVGKTGNITAKKAGKATISAKYKGKTYKCEVTVKNSVSLSESNVTCTSKEEQSIKVTFTESGSIRWEIISGADIVRVRWANDWDGNTIKLFFTPKSVGTARIKIYSEDHPKNERILTITISSAPTSTPTVNFADELAAENLRFEEAIEKLNNEYDFLITYNQNRANEIRYKQPYYRGSYSQYLNESSTMQDEINSKERRLSLLERDTSGANQLQILSLRKEIRALREEYSELVASWSWREQMDEFEAAAEQLSIQKANTKYNLEQEHQDNIAKLKAKYGIA